MSLANLYFKILEFLSIILLLNYNFTFPKQLIYQIHICQKITKMHKHPFCLYKLALIYVTLKDGFSFDIFLLYNFLIIKNNTFSYDIIALE